MARAPAELPFEIVWLGLSRAASGGQGAGLLMPACRKRAKKARQAGIAAALENRLNQIRCQQRQAEEFPQEGPVDLLGRRQFSQRSMAPLVGEHRAKLHSTNPIERLNGEIKRRTDVVGIFPNEGSITRLVGSILNEPSDEWAATRARCMALETISAISDTSLVSLSAVAD
jgi:Transposase, Mutator family